LNFDQYAAKNIDFLYVKKGNGYKNNDGGKMPAFQAASPCKSEITISVSDCRNEVVSDKCGEDGQYVKVPIYERNEQTGVIEHKDYDGDGVGDAYHWECVYGVTNGPYGDDDKIFLEPDNWKTPNPELKEERTGPKKCVLLEFNSKKEYCSGHYEVSDSWFKFAISHKEYIKETRLFMPEQIPGSGTPIPGDDSFILKPPSAIDPPDLDLFRGWVWP